MARTKKSAESQPDADADLVPSEDIQPEETAVDAVKAEGIAEDSEAKPPDIVDIDTQPANVRTRRGGFFGFLLGGLIAGAAGFGASQYLGNDSLPFQKGPSDAEVLGQAIESQRLEILNLTTQVDALNSALNERVTNVVTDDLDTRLSQSESLAQMAQTSLTALRQRLVELENRPSPSSGENSEAVAIYERELAAMRQMFQQELDQINQAQSEVNAAKTSVANQAIDSATDAALQRLGSAIQSGQPFFEPLSVLQGSGVEIPDILNDLSQSGVVTLAELQSGFPDAARAALNAEIQANAAEGTAGKISTFLRSQLGARSLQPREGEDADAVLSRAEAALRLGDLTTVLRELDDLPDTAVAPLVDWVAGANFRLSAETALALIAASKSN